MLEKQIDYVGFMEQYFDIVDKNERVVPFRLNNVQKLLFDSMCGRDLILKARQEGISSVVLALFAVDFLFMENSRSVCIAHDRDSTIKLFDRVKFFIKSYEDKLGAKVQMRYNTKTELINDAKNSYFYVGTAGSGTFGRSATLTNVHFSEIAFYPSPEETYLSASQAGTPRRIIIESTANGVGDFYYKMWQEAKTGASNYKPHFFGWNQHHEYKVPTDIVVNVTSEEQTLMDRYQLSKHQIGWRRLKMSEFTDPYKFQQEYPLTAEEAFISSGHPVFSIDALSWYKTSKAISKPEKQGLLLGYKPPSLEPNEKGYLKIWAMPQRGHEYVIGADTCEGTSEGDFACAQVLDRKSMEQVAVWHGRIDPDLFGRELHKLGLFYNDALLAPERNGVGLAAVLVLRDLYYPNLYIKNRLGRYDKEATPEIGWATDMKSKPVIIATAQQSLRDRMVILHDEETLTELFTYHYDDKGAANAQSGAHDDRVMALMIALEMFNQAPLTPNNFQQAQGGSNKYGSTVSTPERDISDFYTNQLSGDFS